ncbi:hypothetical protein Ddye_011795 [Dipteronia dyeriana]|uniref:Uncharacterized protein n=1 Tax=Dipteronia dyeriana TaxID=168575 RepID=A0AAE0CHK9_9ROSI|nr:hypothetical protein Ddye_011795 [Dipteronia dyeriana]
MSAEASGGGASAGTKSSDPRFSEEENKLFDSFEKDLEVVNETGRRADHGTTKIRTVPYKLRGNDKFDKYFLPKMFSFGPNPCYPDDGTLGMVANKIKVNLAGDFLKQNGVEKKDLYVDIKNLVKELKDCYDDEFTDYYEDKDHELAWMFLVDGCAILQFMYISVDFRADPDPETQLRKLGIKSDHGAFLMQDMFLLENQLPYQLLQLIIRHAKRIMTHTKEDELLESIYKFIFYCIRTSEDWYKRKDEILKYLHLKHEHVHLLHLLRKMLIQPLDQMYKTNDFIETILGWAANLFDKLRCNRNEYWAPFRNIRKLREAGINLKPSETSCVTDITFIGGTLKLPPISLDESTASTFFNILAYEMCHDFHNEYQVSSYVYFMNKLIDRTEDVEELREKNILQHEFGSDEDVVKLFNEIGSLLFLNSDIYYEVKWKIDNYFDNRGFMWLRKVIHDIHQYFKNRWSLLALIAALLALASGIIQTVYTVFAYQADSKKASLDR